MNKDKVNNNLAGGTLWFGGNADNKGFKNAGGKAKGIFTEALRDSDGNVLRDEKGKILGDETKKFWITVWGSKSGNGNWTLALEPVEETPTDSDDQTVSD